MSFNPTHHTYEGLAKIIHSQDKYKHLPIDAVDEIVELAKSRHPNDDKAKVLYAYFDHAVKCKVVKKFPLTNKEKQLLFVAIQFLSLFLDDAKKKYKDVSSLYNLLTRIATRHHKDIEKQVTYAYKQFEKITNAEDVLCNHLVLASTLSVFFAKDANIDTKLKNKIKKLANKIHDDVAKTEEDTEMYLNAANICARFYENIERKNNECKHT